MIKTAKINLGSNYSLLNISQSLEYNLEMFTTEIIGIIPEYVLTVNGHVREIDRLCKENNLIPKYVLNKNHF